MKRCDIKWFIDLISPKLRFYEENLIKKSSSMLAKHKTTLQEIFSNKKEKVPTFQFPTIII